MKKRETSQRGRGTTFYFTDEINAWQDGKDDCKSLADVPKTLKQ
jgi:hypothetical protein